MTTPVTITSITNRWLDPQSRPLFKGKLISDDGCKCAQGDVLSCAGWTDKQLRILTQRNADQESSKILGISFIHSILLRYINDKKEGAPQDVLIKPENVIGKNADIILGFWAAAAAATADAADAADADDADAAAAAAAATAAEAADAAAAADAADADAAEAAADADAAEAAADADAAAADADAAAAAAADAAADSAYYYKYYKIKYATYEIVGMDILISQNKQPYFLAVFGFDTWDKVKAIPQTHNWREKARF